MNKNKAVLVEKNGQQLKYKINSTKNLDATDREHAAALDDDSDDSSPAITGLSKSNKSIGKKKQASLLFLKPIVLAITSAVIIGSLLGFLMLRIFVDVEADKAGQASNNLPAQAVNGNSETSLGTTSISLEPLKAHVLQAGIFSEAANAEEWAENYASKGISTMIWQRDNQYFLLAGIATTQDQAKVLAEEMKQEQSVDIFVKEWSTIAGETEVSTLEQEWIVKFQQVWLESITSLTDQGSVTTESWSNLLSERPESTEKLTPLINAINDSDDQINAIKLLEWMKLYEGLIS